MAECFILQEIAEWVMLGKGIQKESPSPLLAFDNVSLVTLDDRVGQRLCFVKNDVKIEAFTEIAFGQDLDL